jgi:alkylation response protein AidB-like acyl-CoA dehydrogenase
VDFELTDLQKTLQSELRRALNTIYSPTVVGGLMDGPQGIDRKKWTQLAELGIFSLDLAEEQGGAGLGMAEATIVFEELGFALTPGPLIPTFLAGSIVEGSAAGWTIVGMNEDREPRFIEHAASIDALITSTSDGLRQVDPKEIEWKEVARPLDPLTPVYYAASPIPDGTLLAGLREKSQLIRRGSLLVAAYQVGLAAAAVKAATAYALDRHQFGRPVGSFQAVKHLLADALASTEIARVTVNATGVEFDEGASERNLVRGVSSARVLAASAAEQSCEVCVQVHGGLGYTWEALPHLLLKRSLVLDTQFGNRHGAFDDLASSLARP